MPKNHKIKLINSLQTIALLASTLFSALPAVAFTSQDEPEFPKNAVTRIVDAATGQPIPGAKMSAVAERIFPSPATWPPLRVAVADSTGRVRMRADDLRAEDGRFRYDWLLFEAEGYAPRLECVQFPNDVESLARAHDLRIQVVDYLGRPAADVHLGLILGCGHTPDLRESVTDREGYATLRGIDPTDGNLWPSGEGVRADELSLPDDWKVGDPTPILVADRGATIRGTVLDEGGRPAAGLLVGDPHRHRGPWTRTDSAGRFILHGVGSQAEVCVVPNESRDGIRPTYDVVPGYPATLRLPAFGDDPATPGREIQVRIEADTEATEDDVFIVTAVREEDGYAMRIDTYQSTDTIADGDATLRLPAGTYLVRTHDPSESFAPTETRIVVDHESPRAIRLRVPRRETFPFVIAERDRDALWVKLVAPDFEYVLTDSSESVAPWPERGPVRVSITGPKAHHVKFITLESRPSEELQIASPWDLSDSNER